LGTRQSASDVINGDATFFQVVQDVFGVFSESRQANACVEIRKGLEVFVPEFAGNG